jgi:hypothetical protein
MPPSQWISPHRSVSLGTERPESSDLIAYQIYNIVTFQIIMFIVIPSSSTDAKDVLGIRHVVCGLFYGDVIVSDCSVSWCDYC